ncbi:bifunctional homocysteine S-methyltransferase/methylenetetrahydrofolate reductase [candidate division KSB1 bacterium]|nr:bifunctional homocysteine S-methyltransferase/methylenetetrahydrofolate reductase [candidate division KSB1 bacterium]NIR71945.1 bifunctional homocysteine S-methyltransferase/methylenetetrahydrofolate reductase [candidate division KSB1 bacterium]NIS28012.1 bifunctional homocysteine S-methyltransferase/methylenetetrahydrofolate reductase [candidate division KSB1 bacterium]NIT74882.1 bifunctional homocysteine S-methyltransferase/methylenetetrahydrofolate reductase [candidate division KSB1 bacter
MNKNNFLEELERRVILFDGAMGTMLYDRGIFINQCFENVNLSNPRLVKEIHTGYANAGADVLQTNTFGANQFKLLKHGLRDSLEAINYQGAKLAREVAGDQLYVAGSLGPLGVKIEPWGKLAREEAKEAFKEQAQALLNGGVDLFTLETFSDLGEIEQAIKAVRELCGLPIVAAMTIDESGNSLYGTATETFTYHLDRWGADVVGVNCSVGPPSMMNALEKMVHATKKPIIIQPNAGNPRVIDQRNIYLASPEYMAEFAMRFIKGGARLVGGCCGTTPEHIKAMEKSVRMLSPRQHDFTITIPQEVIEESSPAPLEERSRYAAKLVKGELVTSVEIVPPRGSDPSKVLESSRRLKEFGVDAINVPDGPRALCRMGAQHLSILIEQQVGMETILHYCCRDRNLLGMQSDVMGLYAVGLRNILIITGDPPKMGDYPDATAVFDVDAIGLTNMVNRMNHGVDLGGTKLDAPTAFHIGVGLNPGAIDVEHEIRRFEWKVDAGAEYAITQPVFDPDILLDFLPKIKHIEIPIIAGVWPLVSLRNAEFMNTEVPGASVPDRYMERMRKAQEISKEEARAEGLRIAQEAVAQAREHVQGFQVSAPFGKVDYSMKVLSVLKEFGGDV